MKKQKTFYLLSLLFVLALSFYPLYMGVRVCVDMITSGSVLAENYPKYLIPYTPVSLAIIFGVAIMPIAAKLAKKHFFPCSAALSVCVFFISELLLEKLVLVSETVETTVESWQMFMCFVSPTSYTTSLFSPVKMLIGDYSPWFKLHFYIISVIIVLSVLNCIYGFYEMLSGRAEKRKKSLILQSVSACLFLALCVLACFTAFWRTGNILVSPISAILMILFFVIFGLTAGFFHASFVTDKKTVFSKILPAVTACVTTAIMYVGELILLDGKLYRFGVGFFFDPLGALRFSLCDIAVIVLSGVICYLILSAKKAIFIPVTLLVVMFVFCAIRPLHIVTRYEPTDPALTGQFFDEGKIVTIEEYYEMSDGTFKTPDGYTYKHRLEISGRMHAALRDSTYIILSNDDDITFDMAWKAAGFSSNLDDYFKKEDALIVGMG